MTLPIKAKLVVVGDGECGKTSLLYAYVRDQFFEEYVPTVFETYVTDITADNGEAVELSLWDTAGQEEYDRLRPISYPDTNVILICFAVENRDSFANVKNHWLPEVRHFCGDVPIILVGTKQDLRSNEKQKLSDRQQLKMLQQRPIDNDEGKQLAAEIGAYAYLECSSKTRDGVADVFTEAVRAVVSRALKSRKNASKSKKRQCLLV